MIVFWMIMALIAVGLTDTLIKHRAWFRHWLYELGWFEPAPEQRTLDEYAHDLDDRTITEAVAAVPELDLDGTQPIEQVYQDPPAGSPLLVPVQGDWVPVTYEPPIPPDVLGPGAGTGGAAHPPRPEYAPFQPHAGPAAWSPRHAKTSWLDELITDCLGAPSVEVYMWNWQQRHRLAVTA